MILIHIRFLFTDFESQSNVSRKTKINKVRFGDSSTHVTS